MNYGAERIKPSEEALGNIQGTEARGKTNEF